MLTVPECYYGKYSGAGGDGTLRPFAVPARRSAASSAAQAKLGFVRGYLTSKLLSSTDTSSAVVFEMYFTLDH